MRLVIVESPGQIKPLKALLGADFLVRASFGHVRDLPRDMLGVAIENDFAETYVVTRPEVVTELRKLAQRAEVVYLATDPDREGEAAAWHLAQVLPQDCPLQRVVFAPLTAQAVREALDHPRAIDEARVDAQRTRRILDRLLGYTVSPLLRDPNLLSDHPLSAGRVQTAALRLVVQTERARRAFEPRRYWRVSAELAHGEEAFWLEMVDSPLLDSPSVRDRALNALCRAAGWQVERVEESETVEPPPLPFTTASLLQAASSALRLEPGGILRAARELYEQGLVSYVCTDSSHVSTEAQCAARQVIERFFGPAALPAVPPIRRVPGRAQAHGAIRPTGPARLPAQLVNNPALNLLPDAALLYELIWLRFVASQMRPARTHTRELQVRPLSGDEAAAYLPYRFEVRSSRRVEADYRALYPADVEENGEGDETPAFPTLQEGDRLSLRQLAARQQHTRPPERLSQTRLVAELERWGIGRPVTYASTIETILDRGYVAMAQGTLVPTPLGETLFNRLQSHFPGLFELAFSAELEAQLDRVARGELSRSQVLEAFYRGHLAPALEKAAGAARVWPSPNRDNLACSLPLKLEEDD